MDHPLPWLRYVDARSVSAPQVAFEGMKVRNDSMDTLGKVNGFIVDDTSMRPYYVVVDSGGWFKSKEFLVPIGHARLDDDRDAVVVDLAKSRIERFPGFDRSEFKHLGESDIRRMNDAICDACNDDGQIYPSVDPLSAVWGRPDFAQPEWWSTVDYSPSRIEGATGELRAEQERKRERSTARHRDSHDTRDERELVTAREAERSPYFDGRAQPGDVIGLETGGESTHIGETAEDENKRRIDAERAARKTARE